MEGKTVLVKLLSGEEVVGVLSKQKKSEIIIEHPFQVVEQYSQYGRGLSLVRWIPYTDDITVAINSKAVISIVSLMDALAEIYLKKRDLVMKQHEELKRTLSTSSTTVPQVNASPSGTTSPQLQEIYKAFLEEYDPDEDNKN